MDGIAATDPVPVLPSRYIVFRGGPFVHHQRANPASASVKLLPFGALDNLLIQTTCQPEKKFFHICFQYVMENTLNNPRIAATSHLKRCDRLRRRTS